MRLIRNNVIGCAVLAVMGAIPCVVAAESVSQAEYATQVLYVDASAAEGGDGKTAERPLRDLQAAIDQAVDGNTIYVNPGIYRPILVADKKLRIESTGGKTVTIIDGGGTNRCATLGTSAGQTNTVLRGFTLRNGNANGSAVTILRNSGGGVCYGMVEDCVVVNNEARSGGGAFNSVLTNCSVVGNRAGTATQEGFGGGVTWTHPDKSATACYIADNQAYRGSAVYVGYQATNCLLSSSLVVMNTALLYGTLESQTRYALDVVRCTIADNNCAPHYYPGTMSVVCRDSIVHYNSTRSATGDFSNNSHHDALTNCCTTVYGSTSHGTGIVTEPPAFVDRSGRIYDLLVPSGTNIVGASKVVDTNGQFKVSVEIDGLGAVTRSGAVVAPGAGFEIVAEETGRTFEGFYTNGVFTTANKVLELADIQSDIHVTARFAKRTAFVAETGDDANDGLTSATAKRTIHAALPLVENGESIEVAPGTYEPIAPTGYASKGKSIRIYSTHGAAQTVIDGGGTNRCVDLSDYYGGTTNAVLRGFTLRNGHAPESGGGVNYGTLINCWVVGNEAVDSGGGAYQSRLENCVVARNKAGTNGGGLYSCTADRSTICGNRADGTGGGTYSGTLSNCIVYQNLVGRSESNWVNGAFDSCCASPNRGTNPIRGDPLLVDGWNGDARLRVGSSCFVGDVQVCGADVGAPVEGVSVSVGVQGVGVVSNATFLVSNGDSVTIASMETVRPFRYWDIGGEHVTNRVYMLTNVTADVRAVAVFDTFDWFVDASVGDDANDGFGWGTAKRTLQAAIDLAVEDETIYVAAGTYTPISTNNKRIRIESRDGAGVTFIDGGGTNRCATLRPKDVSNYVCTNSILIGFTLLNGYVSWEGTRSQFGGGAVGGTLESCIVSNCVIESSSSRTWVYGGGTHGSALVNCLVSYNAAISDIGALGGGVWGGTLRGCTIVGNKAVAGQQASYVECGGYGGWNNAYNSIIWGNAVEGPNAAYPNAGWCYLYNCCADEAAQYRYDGTITNDPQFVDADAGDFRLKPSSPCLNAGNNAYVQGETDLAGNDRIQGVRVDMGCYEGATIVAPPGAVSGLCAVRGVLTWEALADAEDYRIYRSTDRVASSAQCIGTSDTNGYTDETAEEGVIYYYWVWAINALGEGAMGEAAEVSWPPLPEIVTDALPVGMENEPYSVNLTATNGTAPYAWQLMVPGYGVSRAKSSFAEVGTAQDWQADDRCWEFELPFDFPFYDSTYRKVYVSSNGTLAFDGWLSQTSYYNALFAARAMIAVLWRDLKTTGGDIYVASSADSVTIRWEATYYSGGGVVAASATLYRDGKIRLSYGTGNENGGVVGVSSGDGVAYTLLNWNGESLDQASDVILTTGHLVPAGNRVLPRGLSFSEEGVLSGRPMAAVSNEVLVCVTDSDGGQVTRPFSLVIAANPNRRPVIESVAPVADTSGTTYVLVNEGQTFSVTATDPEGAPLSYEWRIDGEVVEGADEASFTYCPTNEVGRYYTIQCFVSDGYWRNEVSAVWSVKIARKWYVDAAATEGGDGSSVESAFSWEDAMAWAEDGDTICVAPGTYEMQSWLGSGWHILVVASEGPSRTFLRGYCGGIGQAPTLKGFTLKGFDAYGISLQDCVLTGDEDGNSTSANRCRLENCLVTGNRSGWDILESCEVVRCTLAGNVVRENGVICSGNAEEPAIVRDSIVWGNVTADGAIANYDTDTWLEYRDGTNEAQRAYVRFENSCTWPMPLEVANVGNITNDPWLVDIVNGDLRVRAGSPCLDANGVQTMGARLGDPVEGFVLSVRIVGNGGVSPLTAVVPAGGSATFAVTNAVRPFLGFSTNGVFAAADKTLVWSNVRTDGIVTAAFSNSTFHVDAATGNDANDGLSWESPKASIQSAIDATLRGETILVKPGTYAPIVTKGHPALRIVGIEGKGATLIDGGGTNACARLYCSAGESTLVGFTITNGCWQSASAGGEGFGGGVSDGTIEDCDVVDCVSDGCGAGITEATAIRCRILGNRAVSSSSVGGAYTVGGAYYSTLVNCLVADNEGQGSGTTGGALGSALYNCTVVGNSAVGSGSVGGVDYGDLYNTIVYGNSSVTGTSVRVVSDVASLESQENCRIGTDPGFVDMVAGDYRLASGSPCIDAGANSFVQGDRDLDGNPRLVNGTVDIGCYESQMVDGLSVSCFVEDGSYSCRSVEGDAINFTVALSGSAFAPKTLYAYLLCDGVDAAEVGDYFDSSCLVTNAAVAQSAVRGLLLSRGSGSVRGCLWTLDNTSPSGCDFSVVLCTSSTYDPAFRVDDYKPGTPLHVRVVNARPSIGLLEANGRTDARPGEAFLEKFYVGVPIDVRVNADDVVRDLSSLSATWRYEDKSVTTSALTNTLVFSTSGTHQLTLTVADKDGGVSVAQFVFVVESPKPDLSVSIDGLAVSSLMPGDTVTVRYVESNYGVADACAPWTDKLMLRDASDAAAYVYLRSWEMGEGLAVGLVTTNSVTCVIPDLVPLAGAVRFVLEADADGVLDETNESNNRCTSAPFLLGTCLYLSAAAAEVKENVAGGVRFTVRRSGPVDEALTVTVGAADATDVTAPATVTIPAGSVSTIFTVAPVDNSAVDGTRLVPVSVSADGFRGAFVPLTILDDEVPRLSVTLSQTSIREGDGVIIVTVTREGSLDEPLTVYLNGGSSRVSLPASVIIPAGEASITFEISVPDNEMAQVAANLTLRASAAGYASASADYTVEDDDVPGVTLTLSPETVSEGAGASAVYATLTRSDTNHLAQAVRVRLTASEANQLILPGEITIPKYTRTVRFAIGVIDNAQDDGDREVTVKGAVVIESCGCDGQPSNGDVIQATLGIIDNDGPALALVADPATMREGLSPAGYLTLSHNSTLTEDLTVRLWVDEANADEIALPETVTIPAGETSVRIPVTTLDDGVEDGGQLVSVYAEDAAGVFAAASTWIQVSDQNLPDLKVASVETAQAVVSKESLPVAFVVTNVGFMARSGAIPYAVHLVKGANGGTVSSATLVKSGTLTGDLAVKGSLSGTVQVTAPELPGDYRVAIVLDPDGTISELDAANNTGWSAAFAVGAAYTATAGVDGGKVYLPGATVTITGQVTRADGTVAAHVPVDVYVMVNGLRRTLSAESAADGHYAVAFAPTSGEAGDYTVGAAYPGVGSSVAQDGFSILGMKRTSTKNVIWDFALGDTETRTVSLANRSAVPLTGVTVSLRDVPAACKLVADVAKTLPANGHAVLTLTATAVGVTEQVDYQKFWARIDTAEGVSLEIPLYFHAQTQQACLRATPAKIDTTMAVGATRYLDVTILNDGKGDSGALTAIVPEVRWLKIMAGASIANLASGESAVITLALTPTEADGLTLNNPLAGGQLVVNCANGKGCAVPLRFTPVSEATGRVSVDVVDNNTYYLESRPHLSNATVKVSNPYTGAVVATGQTGEDGIWTASGIPEGTYQLTITAASHETYADSLVIEPGKEARVTAFLQYRLVTATWDVKKTEIEDSYDIDLVLEFETQVPAPVVKTTMPDYFDELAEGESVMFTMHVENCGFIAAEQIDLVAPEMENHTFTFSDNNFRLAAGEARDVAVKFERQGTARARLASSRVALGSRALAASAGRTTTMLGSWLMKQVVHYFCGGGKQNYQTFSHFRYGKKTISSDDDPDFPPFGIAPVESTRDPVRRNVADDDNEKEGEFEGGTPVTTGGSVSGCNISPCIESVVGCLLDVIGTLSEGNPIAGCILGVLDCGQSVYETISDDERTGWDVANTVADCGLGIAGCFGGSLVKGLILTGIGCVKNIVADCLFPVFSRSTANAANLLAASSETTFADAHPAFAAAMSIAETELPALRNWYLEIFGDEEWLRCSRDEITAFLQNWKIAIKTSDGELKQGDLAPYLPSNISDEQLARFLSRWNAYLNGTVSPDSDEAGESEAFRPSFLVAQTKAIAECEEEVAKWGYDSIAEFMTVEGNKVITEISEAQDAVCASVKLSISQTMAMTREAFSGTLTVYNGNTETSLADLKMSLVILDANGYVVGNDLFATANLGTSGGMSGDWILDGGMSVAPGTSGTAVIQFVPTRNAAPDSDTIYRIGGRITYTDPFSGEAAAITLAPVTITVSPSPYLHLDYFVQRDVYADSPFTPDVVEASLPAELAVLVRNVGGGEAKGVTIASAVPETVLNEKGLSVAFDLKDYTLEATALNGATAHLGLNTVSLGTVAPNESKVAQWWLTSSIEGHFVGMSATVTPVNSWNTPDTTLVDPSVGIHKLIRSIVADGDALPDFLVCDSADLYGRPDTIYTANGDVLPVAAASVATSATLPTGSEVALPVSLTPAVAGWNCGSAVIPGIFSYTVVRIVRADGSEVPLRNVWLTDRTFRDGTTPLREERLHMLDACASADVQTYTVTLKSKSTDVPEVASFEGVTDGGVEYATRDAVTVTFTKPIEATTFTTDDLRLTRQGESVTDLSALTITAADETGTRFTIGNLAALCGAYGRYELTVQCAGIADINGNLGRVGKSVAWTFAPEGSEAPQLSALTRVASDGFGGMTFLASFDRAVVPTCVTLANWTLRRNGDVVAWPTSAKVAARNAAEYALSGVDAVLNEDGVYELTFSATGVSDAAGHAATGEKTVSWTVDRTPPGLVSDLRISPDGGFSDSDGITWSRELTVSGTLPETGLTVEILCRYVGGGETVLATLDADATRASLPFAQAIVLPGAGNVTLVVRLTDAAGNTSDTEKDIFVDALALTGTLSGAPTDTAVVASSVTLAFSDRVMEGDVSLAKFTLVRDGKPIALEGVSVTKVDDVTFTLTGLDVPCAEDGAYVLRFDGSVVRKHLSGLAMGGTLALRWQYAKPDRVPPTVMSVLFDGEEPYAAYTNVFSQVAVTFSEAVNVPELIEKGLIGRAARIDLLDAANVVTGSAAVVQAATWNAQENTLAWAIDPATIPVGQARLTLEAGLISDLAGNRLSADGCQSVDGLRAYVPSEQKLAQVNAQAMPCWHDGTLYVGEKTADGRGKIRRYAADGTWSYLQADGADIEIPSEGCQGASVAFADTDGDCEAEIYVGTADGRVLKYPGGEEAVGLSLANGRAMPFAVDLNGDGRDELIVGGLDGRLRVLSRDMAGGTWISEARDLLDSTGAPLNVPNGRAAPVVADINHDGFPDILSGDTAGNVWAFLGEGATWCAQPIAVFANTGAVADRSRLGMGDVDGDGVADLVVGRSDGSVTLMRGVERPTPSVAFEVCAFTLAMSVNAEELDWTTGGAAEWLPVWEAGAYDGQHCAQSGVIGNDTNVWIETTVEGAGVLSFAWRCSTEARYDMCQLLVDGEVKGVISGETPWTTNAVALVGGAHTVRWNYRKSRSGAAGEDRVWLDAVSWTPEVPLTLAEALNPELFWETKGDVAWTAVRKQSVLEPRDGWAVAEGLSDYGFSSLETLVYGAGSLTFDWAVSCEDGYDWFDFLVDGEIRESITGETAWKTVTIEFPDAGRHVLKWEYWKDDMDEAGHAGENRAKLDNVVWTPLSADSQWTVTTPDPIPFDVIRTDYGAYWKAAKGDYETAAHLFGRNGYAIWQSYVAGLNPDEEGSRFKAKIEMADGKPVVTWEPDTPELRATRAYTTYGKKTLLDREWTPVTDANRGDYNFFKVEVRMK